MDTLQNLATFGADPEWLATDAELAAGASGGKLLASAALRRARKIVEDLHAEFADTDANRELSAEGKALRKARAVKDTEARLRTVAEHREKLLSEVGEARSRWTPQPVDEATAAALWAVLPADVMQVKNLYRDAVISGDWRTAGAIEELPIVYPGRPLAEEMRELRQGRLEHEAPEVAKAIAEAEEYASAADTAYRTASEIVGEMARGLPDPTAESGLTGPGPDGLRTFTPSGYEAALAAGGDGAA